jgi:CelD/BcsL family acetyltransferase involved in cellulose biosynthesis
MTELTIEAIDDAAKLAAIAPEWNALAAAHGEGLPFRTWEWNDAWWRWFGEDRLVVRDALFFRAVRGRDGRLVGVAPLILVRRPGVGIPLMRGLEFVGADPYVTELRGALVDPAHERDVYRALGEHLQEQARRWDWVRWLGLRAGSDGERVVADAGGTELTKETPAYWLRLEGTWDSFRASRPRNLKESLRKCYNSLKRDGHTVELDVAREPSEVRPALDRFLALHQMRASADGLLSHADVFCDAPSRGFFLDVCTRLAARDALRVFQLRVRGDVVAARVGFALGSTLYLYFSGYDPSWARYSVMTTTLAEAVRYAFVHRFEIAHLSAGTDEAKVRWRPERTVYRERVHYADGLRGKGARLLREALTAGAETRFGQNARQVLGRRRGS